MSLDVNIDEPEEFNCSELHNCIQDVANKKGFKDFEYSVEHVSGKGVNFISNVFRVTIKNVRDTEESENSDKSKDEETVIVKTLLNTERQKLFHDLHVREVKVYEEVIPKFKELQNDVNYEDRIVFVDCLYASTEAGREIIVFEDLIEKGFKMDESLQCNEQIHYAKVSLIMKELAKYHAGSFVFETRHPKEFDKLKNFKDILYEDRFLNVTKLRGYIFESFDMSLKEIEEANVRKKLGEVRGKVLQALKVYMKTGGRNALCHGDCWMNNILFKHEDSTTKVCFIDFQTARFANPVTDVIYFLYLCTDSKFRSDNLQALQYVYYDSLKSTLKLYDIEADIVYPRDAFENDINVFLPYGLLIALVDLRIVTPDEDCFRNFEEKEKYKSLLDLNDDTINNDVPLNRLFNMRINDVIKESIENGVLDELVKICSELK